MQVLIIDPPSGWQYGFPKEMPNFSDCPANEDINAWLVEQGYPQSIIDQFDGNLPCRYWYQERS